MKIKKALITGVSGQDGSLLAELLLNKGYLVYGLMRSNSSKDNLENILKNKAFNLIEGDLLNNDLIAYLIKTYQFNEIYNLASQSNIRLSYDNPIHTFNVTLMGVIVLLENIKKYSPQSKTFQAGSSAMFGNNIDHDGFQRETTPMKPISPYASSKLFAHNICCNYRENENLFISNGILYNHESFKSKTLPGVLKVIINKAINFKNGEKEKFHIPNLKVYLDLGHAEDYVEAMWLILQQNKADDFIISSNNCYSLEEICNKVFSKLNLNFRNYITTNKNSILSKKLIGDNSKLKKIGWDGGLNIDLMIEKILETIIKKTNEKNEKNL